MARDRPYFNAYARSARVLRDPLRPINNRPAGYQPAPQQRGFSGTRSSSRLSRAGARNSLQSGDAAFRGRQDREVGVGSRLVPISHGEVVVGAVIGVTVLDGVLQIPVECNRLVGGFCGLCWASLRSCDVVQAALACQASPPPRSLHGEGFSISCCIRLRLLRWRRLAGQNRRRLRSRLSKNEGVPSRTPCGECGEPFRRADILCPTSE